MSTKKKILAYLASHAYWVSGSELERQADNWQTKASTISRRARELFDDQDIERELSPRNTVQYRHPRHAFKWVEVEVEGEVKMRKLQI